MLRRKFIDPLRFLGGVRFFSSDAHSRAAQEEAIETGLTVKYRAGNAVRLELAMARPTDLFERVELRHLNLVARRMEAEAAELRAHYAEKLKRDGAE